MKCAVSPEPLLLTYTKHGGHKALTKNKTSTVKVLKFRTFFLSVRKRNVGYQGWNSQNICQNGKPAS